MSAGSMVLMDAAGRRRSPATTPGYLAGRAPHNKGMQYPPDPPRPEEIIVVMRQAGRDRHGLRLRALIEAGMDQFGFEQLAAWMTHRVSLPVGPLFCVIDGRPAAGAGRRPPPALNCDSSPPRPASVADSHPISYATPTQ
jgi:hypothetical protein